MTIQWSLVLFTVFAGTGAWLLACGSYAAAFDDDKKIGKVSAITAVVLLIIGGLLSVTHLSHPTRMLAALSHPTSGIFVEAALIFVLIVVAVVFYLLLRRGLSGTALKVVSVIAIALAAIFTYACGSSYMMPSRPTWNMIALPFGYAGTALISGVSLYALVCTLVNKQDAKTGLLAKMMIVGAAIALVVSLVYGIASGAAFGSSAPLFWVGVALSGIVPGIVGVVYLKKKRYALGAFCLALVSAFAGAVVFRVLMWVIGVAIMNSFGMEI